MQFSKQDQMILADLRKAKSIYPDLKEILDFYENLFQTQFTFKSRLAGQAEYWEKKEINLYDLKNGIPQIRFEELDLQPVPLLTLFRRIVKLMVPYAGSPDNPEAEPSPEKVVEYAREIFLNGDPLVTSGSLQDLVRSTSGFALAPYLQNACEWIRSQIPPHLWYREYCPICGGRPSFAALTSDSGSRTLLCARCLEEWKYDRIGCPYCKSNDSQIYYPSSDGKHRLYVCEACNRYLKTVDVREGGQALCLPVEGIVTVSMDLAAQEKGYRFF